MPPGFKPSDKMLDEVGLDFDHDLGGLKKGPALLRPRLHPAWAWLALAILPMLIAADARYGFGFIAGALAALVWQSARR